MNVNFFLNYSYTRPLWDYAAFSRAVTKVCLRALNNDKCSCKVVGRSSDAVATARTASQGQVSSASTL
jgi:hypothetical protein